MIAQVELALADQIMGLDGLNLADFAMEPKLDGWRFQVIIAADGVHSYTRQKKDATGKLPAVELELAEFQEDLDGTVLDCEAVYLDPSGRPDFHYTASCLGSGVEVCRAKQRREGYVSILAFDLLRLRGLDTRGMPWSERRDTLEALVEMLGCPHVRVTEVAEPSLEQHLAWTAQYGEGSMLKRKNAPYVGGRIWLKWKATWDADVVVMGSEPAKEGKFAGLIGAVRFGQYRDSKLVERGKCSGMTDAVRQQLTADLPVGAVMRITHNGILAAGGFRHPQFQEFRHPDDKAPEACTWDEPPKPTAIAAVSEPDGDLYDWEP
jgi:ATP-dependent DNA ligase